MDRGKCRGCGEAIYWVRMKSGKRNPMNAEPDPERGNVLVVDDEVDVGFYGVPLNTGVPLGADQAAEARTQGTPLYLSHFATCPARARFRKEAGN